MNGKAKGSAYERSFCTLLSEWWTGGAKDDVFWRTSGSGGRATVRHSKGRATAGAAGDVCAVDMVGQALLDVCSIELKRGYSSANLADVLDSPDNAKPCTWLQFYKQAKESQQQSGAFSWMIVWKRDRREALVFIPQRLYDELLMFGEWAEKDANPFMIFCAPGCAESGVVVITLKEWFTGVRPETIRKIAAEWKEQRNAG